MKPRGILSPGRVDSEAFENSNNGRRDKSLCESELVRVEARQALAEHAGRVEGFLCNGLLK